MSESEILQWSDEVQGVVPVISDEDKMLRVVGPHGTKEERLERLRKVYDGPPYVLINNYTGFVIDELENRLITQRLYDSILDASYRDPSDVGWHGPVAPAADEREVMAEVAETITGYEYDYDIEEMLEAVHDAGWKLVRNV